MQEMNKRYFHPIYKDYACDISGNIYSMKTDKNKGKLLKIYDNGNDYRFFWIYDKRKIKYYVHRFVYECYHDKLLEKTVEIDHINKNNQDNRYSNLREASREINLLNRFTNEEVSKIPKGSIPIENYGDHKFSNLYFNPLNKCLYKSSGKLIFKIEFKEYKYKNKNGKEYSRFSTQLRDSDKKQANINLKTLMKALDLKIDSE